VLFGVMVKSLTAKSTSGISGATLMPSTLRQERSRGHSMLEMLAMILPLKATHFSATIDILLQMENYSSHKELCIPRHYIQAIAWQLTALMEV